MLFFKKVKKKLNGLWFPQLILVGKPAKTQEVAERLARESTGSPADVHAVIRALPDVMAEIMAEGRSVQLEGLGTFYYTCQASGKGVDSEAKVNANQITAVRVQFLPARQREGTQMTRSLVGNLTFTEWRGKEPQEDSGNDGGGKGDDYLEENPLG